MESTTLQTRCFRYALPWRRLLNITMIGVPCIPFGFALLWCAWWLFETSWWLIFLAFHTALIGSMFSGFGLWALAAASECAILRALCISLIRVTGEGLWLRLSQSGNYFYVCPPSIMMTLVPSRPRDSHSLSRWAYIPFASITWIKREQPNSRDDFVSIVYGPDLRTASVGDQLGAEGFESLLALLAERCPQAFTPEPPAGWRRPSEY